LLSAASVAEDMSNSIFLLRKKKEKSISKQPIIFNITYTPWKLKSNATAKERAKFERERPYYEMSGGNNI